MFSGLVQALGEVEKIDTRSEYAQIKIHSPKIAKKLSQGDSVSVNGVCLTALNIKKKSFEADVMVQTLKLTSLGSLREGSPVNLELASTPDSFLGGHIVQGHVDGVGNLRHISENDKWWRYDIEIPAALKKYVQNQGSICVDGVSLTVGEIDDRTNLVTLWLIPETLAKTNLKQKSIGDPLNIEVDVLAKYVERLLNHREKQSGETREGEKIEG
jgi:riboflavin synthase